MKIGKVSLIAELNENYYAIVLPQEKLRELVEIAVALSDNRILPTCELSKEFELELIKTPGLTGNDS